MLTVGIAGQGEKIPKLKKFVVTAFADVPAPGYTTGYAEVCATPDQPFVVLLPRGAVLSSKHNLYFDSETCSRFLSEYSQLDSSTGRHRQRVGDELLDVNPSEVAIAKVAPPADHDGSAFRVAFPEDLAIGEALRGTWLVWSHPVKIKLSNRASAYYSLALTAHSAIVDHFYLFLVLPRGHEAMNPLCIVGSTRSIGGERPTNPVHRFDIEPPFPVFPEWRDWIYGHEVLRTRDDIALAPHEEAIMKLTTRSEALHGRVSTIAYATGLIFAVSVNLLTSAILYIQEHGFGIVVLVEVLLGAALSIISAFVGWRSLKQQ